MLIWEEKNGGIFEEWFKNIAILIFLQSFHAVYLTLIMEVIGSITKTYESSKSAWTSDDSILAIIAMVSIMSLIKMEKMIKGIFGFKDSKYMGNIGENLAKGMAGVKSAANMAKRTVEPAKRTSNIMRERTRNKKDLIDAKDKAASKQKAYDELVKAGPSGSKMNRKEYTAKLKEAREAAEQAHKDVAIKEEKDRKLKADAKNAAVQTYSTLGSTVAASAFGIGGTDNFNDAAIIANLTDKTLDSIVDPQIKNTVYGKAAIQQKQHIEELPQQMARDAVRRQNPELAEGSKEFEEKVKLKLDNKQFQKQVEAAVAEAKNTKFEMDMEIPQSKLRQLGSLAGETWKETKSAFSEDSRAGRSYSRNIRKNGIEYKGTNINDVGDI